LRRVCSRALRAAMRAWDAWIALRMMLRASVGCASNQSPSCWQLPAERRISPRVTELGLGLAFELWFSELHGDDRGETSRTSSRRGSHPFLDDLLLARVLVHQPGECGANPSSWFPSWVLMVFA